MDFNLIKVRLVAFGYQAGGLIFLAVVGAVISPEFRDVVVAHAGEGVTGTLVALAFDAIVKHIRNTIVISNATVGGSREGEPVVLV